MPARRKSHAGFTLVETLISMGILLVGTLGLLAMQISFVRANVSGNLSIQGSSLALDLVESARRWQYADGRLTPLSAAVNSLSASAITSKWDMGSSATAAYTAQNSEAASDSNATNSSALGSSYDGLSSDVDRDGSPNFFRYWNVFAVDADIDGIPDGKLVQVIVRWKEPGTRIYHQVTSAGFIRNPAVY